MSMNEICGLISLVVEGGEGMGDLPMDRRLDILRDSEGIETIEDITSRNGARNVDIRSILYVP